MLIEVNDTTTILIEGSRIYKLHHNDKAIYIDKAEQLLINGISHFAFIINLN